VSASDQRDPTRTAKPEVVAALDALLASGGIRSAHYVGYAHEPILRVLHKHFGTQFSVMDYWNRFGIETEFDYDSGERIHENRRPDWLDGVSFYSEGGPAAELMIWDMPWHYPDQLSAIVAFKFKRPPTHLFLVDEACSEPLHPGYVWSITHIWNTRLDYAIGIAKHLRA
jgi:hypothetical protein